MKTYAVDASTSIKSILKDEENYKYSHLLLSDYLSKKIILIAPNLQIYEAANALRSATLAKRISFNKSKYLLGLIFKAKPIILPIENLIILSFLNSEKYQISIYDSAYITLAIKSGVALISSDNKLVKKINNPEIAFNLKDYISP